MPKNKPPVAGRYIDPLVDFSFKKIFGSDPNKDLLKALLNEVFRGRKCIVDLHYNKNEHPGDLKEEGTAIVDLLCTGDKGERFLIEVQRGKQDRFKERTLFYTSRLISDQAPRGKRAEWGYDIDEVYLVAILEDFVLEGSPTDKYLHDICLCNRDTGQIFYDKLGYTYIELSKFVKRDTELANDLDKWLYFLKNMPAMDSLPAYLQNPIFEKLFSVAEYSNLTKEEKAMYDRNMKYKWDNQNVFNTAVKEAREGGKHEKAVAIANELKKEGLAFEFISKVTGLSVEEIEKL